MCDILNLTALCRCCHTNGSLKNLNMCYSFMGETEVYVDMLLKTFGLLLSQPLVEASHSICDICIEKLRNALQFKRQVELCEKRFEEYCRNELVHQKEIKTVNTEMDGAIVMKPEIISIKNEDFNDNFHEEEYMEIQCVKAEVANNENNYNHRETINNIEKQQKIYFKDRKEIQHKHSVEKQTLNMSKSKLQKKRVFVMQKLDESGLGNKQRKQNKYRFKRLKTDNGTVYVCQTCNNTFECRQNLRLHLNNNHSIFICNICKRSFNSEHVLERHALTHNTRYQCNVCGDRFKHLGDLIGHKNIHTRQKVFTCDLCNKDFLYKSILKKHIAYHLGKNKKFICDICGNSFNDSTNLNIHVRCVHEKLKLFKCDQCPKTYATNKTLKVHLRTHTGERPYKCERCDKTFKCSGGLGRHTSKHCGTRMSNKDATYLCKICGEIFHSWGSFASHRRCHIGVNPIRCQICDKDFSTGYSLKRHIKSHQAADKITCEVCYKKFSGKSQMFRHMRNLHNPDKPFKTKVKCDLCKMLVTDIEKHMNTHTGRSLRCELCSKSYSETSALNRHIKERHCGISHDCDLCDKKYIKATSLRTHKFKIHKIQFKMESKDEKPSVNG